MKNYNNHLLQQDGLTTYVYDSNGKALGVAFGENSEKKAKKYIDAGLFLLDKTSSEYINLKMQLSK